MRFKRRQKTKIARIREKRTKGKYKKIGIFFVVCGVILLIISAVLFYLYNKEILFANSIYSAPLPDSQITPGKIINPYNPTELLSQKLTKAGIQYKSINLSSGVYTIIIDKNETVLFDVNKDMDTQISSLQQILQALTIEGKRFSRIDFRYDKPIISF